MVAKVTDESRLWLLCCVRCMNASGCLISFVICNLSSFIFLRPVSSHACFHCPLPFAYVLHETIIENISSFLFSQKEENAFRATREKEEAALAETMQKSARHARIATSLLKAKSAEEEEKMALMGLKVCDTKERVNKCRLRRRCWMECVSLDKR